MMLESTVEGDTDVTPPKVEEAQVPQDAKPEHSVQPVSSEELPEPIPHVETVDPVEEPSPVVSEPVTVEAVHAHVELADNDNNNNEENNEDDNNEEGQDKEQGARELEILQACSPDAQQIANSVAEQVTESVVTSLETKDNRDSFACPAKVIKDITVAATTVKQQVQQLHARRANEDAERDKMRRKELAQVEAEGRWKWLGRAEFAMKRFYRTYMRTPYYHNFYIGKIGFTMNFAIVFPNLLMISILQMHDEGNIDLSDRAYRYIRNMTLAVKGLSFIDLWLKTLFLGHVSVTAKIGAWLHPKLYGPDVYYPVPSMIHRIALLVFACLMTVSFSVGMSGFVPRPADLFVLSFVSLAQGGAAFMNM
eukprot:GFYU01017550.1.p1 GENE.GFYU01017550.1~~GFYU01017550.1.p1  ORF type:complete len:395 (-),score=73.44 GFYU01017550.1:426-1520(-)